jgi:pimeloyl-ACP methyl ester carboxylesterase
MLRFQWLGLLVLAAVMALPARAQELTEGFVKNGDGVELYYVKAGSGAQTVILPARLFTFDDFRWLAQRYTLIAYDMRNRGRSARVEELDKISLAADVADLEAIRRHFQVETFHTIGYSYLGLMVVLYTLEHPERVGRVVQIGPVPLKFGTEYRPEYVASDRQQVIDEHGGPRSPGICRAARPGPTRHRRLPAWRLACRRRESDRRSAPLRCNSTQSFYIPS